MSKKITLTITVDGEPTAETTIDIAGITQANKKERLSDLGMNIVFWIASEYDAKSEIPIGTAAGEDRQSTGGDNGS